MTAKQILQANITFKNAGMTIITVTLAFLNLTLAVVGFQFANKAEAAIPKYINFQGKLTAVANGNNVANGTYAFQFKLYDSLTSGTLLWTETFDQAAGSCAKLPVTNGVFNAKLGSCNPLTSVDFTGGSLYLTVNFAPTGTSYDGEMTPRKQLVSSAYAFVANGVSGDGGVRNTISSSTALAIAKSGTDYALQVDTSAGSAVTGLKVTSGAAAGGLALSTLSTGTNENLTIDAKGSGTVSINGTATGDILLGGGVSSTGCTVTNSTGALACSAGGSFTTLALTGAVTGAASYNGLVVTANTGVITSGTWNGTALTDAFVSDTLTSSIFVGSGSTTDAIDLGTAEVAGTLSVGSGGTGAGTLTGVLIGNGTSAITGATTSSGISGALSDETGSGALVFATSPILVTPTLGVASATSLTLTGGQTVDITTPAAATATALIFQPGTSSGASSNGPSFTLKGGNASGTTSVTGGATIIQGGNATGASGTRNGGAVTIDGGTGATANGAVNIGTTVAGAINIGTVATAKTISIGNGGTVANTINIGNSAAAHTIAIGNASATNVSIIDNNWSVTTAGVATFAGLTTAGTASINNNNNTAVNIATGTSTALTTIGAGLGTFSLQTTNIDISNTGAITNATGFNGLVVTANTGVITSGTWNGSVIGGTYGGTGVNNGSNTITLGGNINTAGALTTSGAFGLTLTTTALTNVTLPTAGTLATLAGAESLTNKTLNNTNTVTLQDANFTLQDNGDTTKQAQFQLSGISTGTTRTYTLPNADGTLCISGGTCTASSVPISGLQAATGSNTIDNGSHNQAWSWNSLAGGNGLYLYTNSTTAASNNQTLFRLQSAGANANSTQTTYTALFTNLHTGTASTNVALSLNASGGTNNYALITNGGNVGIGDTTPAALLTVGSGDLFQVNSTGEIAAVTGITTSGGYTQSGSSSNFFSGFTTFDNHVVPDEDFSWNLGTPSTAWGNVYTYQIESPSTQDITIYPGDDLIMQTSTGRVVSIGTLGSTASESVWQFAVTQSDDADGTDALIGHDIIITNNSGDAGDTLTGFRIRNADTAANQVTDAFISLDNLETSAAVTAGILFGNSGAITTAIDVQAANIGSALLAGANDLSGTSWAITGSTGAFATASVLQAGSTITVAYSRLGTGTTGHTLDAANDLLISDDLEVDGDAFFDGNVTITSATQGSVLFAGASGVLSQDNANFFWNDTNNFLGIGTTGPDRKLDVLDASNPQLRLTYTDGSVYTDLQTTSAGYLTIAPSASRVGVNVTPQTALHVSGTIRQDAPAGTSGFLQVNGSNLASSTNINPGIDVYHDANNIYGYNIGYTSATGRYNSQAFFAEHADFVVATHASSVLPTTNSDFSPRLLVRGDTGNVGISTIAPNKRLEINSATGDNLRLTYNDNDGSATNYADLLMSSSGDLTVAPSGGDTNITGNLIVSSLTSGATQCLQASSTGVISGTGSACGSGGGGSTAWSALTAPSGNLSLAHGANTTDFTFNSVTASNAFSLSSSSLSSGALLNLAVTGTAAASNTQKALNVSMSGANATASQSTYAGYFSNTHTGTGAANYGLYSVASGASTENNGLSVSADGPSGSLVRGIWSRVGNDTNSAAATLYGADIDARNFSNSTTATTIIGARLQAGPQSFGFGATTVKGLQVNAGSYANGGTVAGAYGIDASLSAYGTASLTSASIIRAYADDSGAATYGSLYGLNLSNWGALSATTTYGIYMDTSIDQGATRYALYSSSTSDSYLAGKLGLGISSSIGANLHVVSSGAVTAANTASIISNTATSSTASIDKIGLSVSSTGTWNGTSAVNYGLRVAESTGGTKNYDIFTGPALSSYTGSTNYESQAANRFGSLNGGSARLTALAGVNQDNSTSDSIGTLGVSAGANTTGTKTLVAGVMGQGYNTGSSTVTSVTGLLGVAGHGALSGTTTTLSSIRANTNSKPTGVVALNAGLYLENQSGVSATAASNYQIYSANTNPFVVRADGNVGIGTSAPDYHLTVENSSHTANQVVFSNGQTGAVPTIPNSYVPTLTVAVSETNGSRPLFFGYDSGASWNAYLNAGACNSFAYMCFNMGQGATDYTALMNQGTTLNIAGGGDGNFTDVVFKNTGSFTIEALASAGTQCLQVSSLGLVSGTGSACGAGGGGMSIGGSITSATPGSVLFAGASGVLAQDNANFFWDYTNSKLGIGVNSSLTGKLHVVGSVTTSGSTAVAGTFSDLTLTNSTASGFQFGNRLLNTINGTTAGTHVGQFIRMTDSTSLSSGQVVRGLEVQAYSGTNNNGVNTGIQSYGKTFGIAAETSAQAGAVSQPAAVFAYLNQASGQEAVGNAIRAYSNTATSADLVSIYQETSAFTGNGLEMNFGNSAGSFTGNFISLQKSGTESFHVDDDGSTFVSLTGTQNTVALCHATNGQTNNDEIVDCSGAPSDVAEYFGTADSTITAGEVVVSGAAAEAMHLDGYHTSKAWITRSTAAYQNSIIGVVSTAPAQAYGDEIFDASENPRPVALVGRVPVKVSAENGPIKVGDYLTSSATAPGKAMKATRPGMVIGQALSTYNGTGIAEVIVFVNPFYYDPSVVVDAEGNVNLQMGTASTTLVAQTEEQAAYTIDQKGSGAILQLQQDGMDRLLVANNGSFNLNVTPATDEELILEVKAGDTSKFTINARGDIAVHGVIIVKDDSFAGSIATLEDGTAEVIFTYHLGTGKPVVQLTAEAQIPVFAQILEFKQDDDGNYTGFVIKTFDLISGPISAVVHYNVTAKQDGYATFGQALEVEELPSGGDGVGLIIEGGEVIGGTGEPSISDESLSITPETVPAGSGEVAPAIDPPAEVGSDSGETVSVAN